jgi:hypothetical protein
VLSKVLSCLFSGSPCKRSGGNPCKNNGRCEEDTLGNFRCFCEGRYTGMAPVLYVGKRVWYMHRESSGSLGWNSGQFMWDLCWGYGNDWQGHLETKCYWLRFFHAFSSVVRQMPITRQDRARSALFQTFLCVLCIVCFFFGHSVYCLYVNVYCTTATRCQPNCI